MRLAGASTTSATNASRNAIEKEADLHDDGKSGKDLQDLSKFALACPQCGRKEALCLPVAKDQGRKKAQ